MKKVSCTFLVLISWSISAQENDTIYLDLSSTVHMLFQSNVLKADIGSGQYIDDDGVVTSDISTELSDVRLKLAPNLEDFQTTNLFIETEQAYYSFILSYREGKKRYVHPIDTSKAITLKKGVALVGSTESGTNGEEYYTEAGELEAICKRITEIEGEVITGKSPPGTKMSFWIDGIYVNVESDKIFVHANVYNEGNITYHWDYTGFFIRNKGNKSIKNEVVQEEELMPIYISNEKVDEVEANSLVKKVFVFDKFTMDNIKVLSIEFWEGQGERKTILEIPSKQVLKASVAR